MPKEQPRDLMDPKSIDKDDHMPGYTGYFDYDGGIRRYQNLHTKENDTQDVETGRSADQVRDMQDEPTRLTESRTSKGIGLDVLLKRTKEE